MTPAFVFDGAVYRAPADLAPGNWNLRLSAVAEDGTAFARRLPFTVR
jgi:nitrogen fixation protein FixH